MSRALPEDVRQELLGSAERILEQLDDVALRAPDECLWNNEERYFHEQAGIACQKLIRILQRGIREI